mmetsp:Transcript_31860/g.49553  ORF Transcript_31860/g.49553 Transcript_31860/m.49553 type:complete len:609 (-) Transcript_31860:93-1919(-)
MAGGIQITDLNLFRDASQARSVMITQTGGDVFITSATSSDVAVLWGENFGSRERKFLRELMTTEIVSFSLQDTYQMHVRTLWHASIKKGGSALQGLRRNGKFALLLHDLHGDMTTSWTWAKFIRPLYRQDFSVIAADLPGYGKSAVAQVCSCPLSHWQPWSGHIVKKVMEELGLTKCQILAAGHSAGILIMLMLSAPHCVEGRHVLVNPVFDRNKLFGHVGSDYDPPPNAKAGWREEIRERQLAAFISMVRTNGIKLWFVFNSEGKHRELSSGRTAPNKQAQEEWKQAADSHDFLVNACQDEFAAVNIKMTEVTNSDLCEAHCGKKIPVSMLVPSRHLKASVARYLADKWELQWQESFLPKHVLHKMRDPKQMDEAFGLTADSDDDDDDDSNVSSRPVSRSVAGLPVERALALRPALMPKSINDDQQRWDNRRGSRALVASNSESGRKSASKMIAWDDSSGEAIVSKSHKKNLVRSASDATSRRDNATVRSASDTTFRHDNATRKPRDSSLSAAAEIAHERLRKSGALAKPLPLSLHPMKKRVAAWTQQAPVEPDLSYGVRKMFLDTFEASVETYRKEQEDAMSAAMKFQSRSAFRAVHNARKSIQTR